MINLQNLFLKLFNNDKYRNIKYLEKRKNNLDHYNSNIYKKILNNNKTIKNKKELNFVHSGHLGDIVYSLATIKKLSETHVCNLFIKINKVMPVKYANHPSGNVYLDKRITELFIPLIKKQKFINNADIYKNEDIDIDLDLFREIPIEIKFHSIRWYMHLTGIQVDMEKPFLEVDEHDNIKNYIVIVRSPRNRNDFVSYNFLNNVKEKIICIGLKEEFEDLRKEIHNLEFYDCKDFLELSKIIKSCRLFIGNLSFAYSVAEGLKVPRLLEASPNFPVVFPVGKKAYDFYHQVHFELFFKKLYEETKN
tara:strand:- start:554 stop:1474 length:921 start_codon:yes stop_codon:yes gene_type:complete